MFFLANFEFVCHFALKERNARSAQPAASIYHTLTHPHCTAAFLTFFFSFLSFKIRLKESNLPSHTLRKQFLAQSSIKNFSHFPKMVFYPKSRTERIIFGEGDEMGICNLEICSQWYLGWEHIPWDCLLSLEPGFANVM